jgi:hypothetical protein
MSKREGSGFGPVPLIVLHFTLGAPVVEKVSCNESGGTGSTPNDDGLLPPKPKMLDFNLSNNPMVVIV